ncbi:MAG: glycosyltransferase family 39 protein [Kiloniellales bacterium]
MDWILRRPRVFLVALVLLAALPGLLSMPPLDRDESRFAQASHQMLESGDLIAIKFQHEPRNKKPAGIHWLQSAAVWVTGQSDAHEIWAYRLPSLAGAILAVLVTFSIGQGLFGRRQGLLAAALLGGCIVVAVEAVNAKTDAMLLFGVVLAQLGLARAWIARDESAPPGILTCLCFWGGLGLGILIKGPLAPMVLGLTLLILCLSTRRWRWLGALRPLYGLPLMVLIAAPWYIAITLQDQSFLMRAANEDLIPKLLQGVESHGQPPGFYLGVQLVALWPAAIFTIPALIAAWQARRKVPGLAFVLAWLIPSWLVFELTPTKLPHYTLPTYPALTLMVAWAVFAGSDWLTGRTAKAFAVLTILGGTAIAVGIVWLPLAFEAEAAVGPGVVAALLVLAATYVSGALVWRGRPLPALAWGTPMVALVMAWGMSLYVPKLSFLWISPRLADAYAEYKAPDAPPLASVGYHEPSLVFLTDTDTALLSAGEAARYLAEKPKALVAVTEREKEAFLKDSAALGVTPLVKTELSGINYSKGRRDIITLYGRSP